MGLEAIDKRIMDIIDDNGFSDIFQKDIMDFGFLI